MSDFGKECDDVKKENPELSYPDVLKVLSRSYDPEVAVMADDLRREYAGI